MVVKDINVKYSNDYIIKKGVIYLSLVLFLICNNYLQLNFVYFIVSFLALLSVIYLVISFIQEIIIGHQIFLTETTLIIPQLVRNKVIFVTDINDIYISNGKIHFKLDSNKNIAFKCSHKNIKSVNDFIDFYKISKNHITLKTASIINLQI